MLYRNIDIKTQEVDVKLEQINEFKIATNASLEQKMNKKITDDATTKKYELGINNGMLYYKEVIE